MAEEKRGLGWGTFMSKAEAFDTFSGVTDMNTQST